MSSGNMRAIVVVAVMFSLMATLQQTLTLPVFAGGRVGYYGEVKNYTDIITINKGLNLFEGDIKLPLEFDRNIISDPVKIWPIPIPLEFDSSLDKNALGVIAKALEQFRLKTCVDFKMRDTESHYIKFYKDAGCFSLIGYQHMEEQLLSIGDGCDDIATVVHELLHALGFWHEQSRYDRDNHVIIIWHNIEPGRESNFMKMSSEVSSLGLDYDYKSVMHYARDAFSNGQGDTILPRVKEFKDIIGQSPGMSPNDVSELNLLYSCKSTVTFLDGCNFEGDMTCELKACSTTKNKWRRVTGIRGGPTEDHSIPISKKGKGHFVHFSTVSGMTGNRGLLQTKKMIPHRHFQCLEFFYYHSGHHTDQLSIWIREFEIGDTVGATTLIGQVTGSSANYWQPKYIQLNTTKAFQIEFEAVKGEGMSSGGFSLDDINVSETVCPHHVWRIRDIEENLQSARTKHMEYSPRFYTSEGYSIQIVLSYFSNVLGVYFRLVSGDNDHSLQWPCPYRQITIQLLEQTPSILQRMSKSFSATISPTDTFRVNGQTYYYWDHPSVVGVLKGDSEGMFYAGPLFGTTSFITRANIIAGDFIRRGAAFLLISFEDMASQFSPVFPKPMFATTGSFTPSPHSNISLCVHHKFSPNRSSACFSSLLMPSIAALTVILSMH